MAAFPVLRLLRFSAELLSSSVPRKKTPQPPNTTLVRIPFLLSAEAFEHFEQLRNEGVSVAAMVARGIEYYLRERGEKTDP